MNTTATVRWTAIDPFFEFALLGMLASGYLAVAGSGYLDPPTAILTGLGLLARAFLALGWIRLDLSPRAVNLLTLAYVAFYPLDYAYLSHDFLTATVHLVFFLAIVKILTAKTERDYFYVKVIAFLELLAASILSSSANYFLFLALFLSFGVATFTASEIRHSAGRSTQVVKGSYKRVGWRLTGLTVFAVVCILLLSGSLFFLLPRTARAAFQHLIPSRYHLPGFSNEVALGQIGELKMRDTAVMHIRGVRDEALPPGLKWRGAALTQFDGKRWFNRNDSNQRLLVEGGVLRLATLEENLRRGKRIWYEVVMQETSSDALFFAGVPEFVHILVPMVVRTPADSYRLALGPVDRLRYRAYAQLEVDGQPNFNGQPLPPAERAQNLSLPPLDPRVAQLTNRITATLPDDESKARAVEAYLRRTFPYTTELPRTESPDPVADFLFQRKKGHCEYFSSAMAVMLRSAGIPARVATGFQSGIYNPISGSWLIRARDAHSWVEAWLPNKGWTTFDPTPPDPNPPTLSWLSRLNFYYDAMQVFWQDWVLAYDIERQLSLAANVEEGGRSFHLRWLDGTIDLWSASLRRGWDTARAQAPRAVALIVILAASVVLLPASWRWWRDRLRFARVQRGDASASDATLLYGRMLQTLRRKGIEKPAWLTPHEFALVVPDPLSSALLREFTSVYNDLRFGNRQDAAPRLVELLNQIEQAPIPKPTAPQP